MSHPAHELATLSLSLFLLFFSLTFLLSSAPQIRLCLRAFLFLVLQLLSTWNPPELVTLAKFDARFLSLAVFSPRHPHLYSVLFFSSSSSFFYSTCFSHSTNNSYITLLIASFCLVIHTSYFILLFLLTSFSLSPSFSLSLFSLATINIHRHTLSSSYHLILYPRKHKHPRKCKKEMNENKMKCVFFFIPFVSVIQSAGCDHAACICIGGLFLPAWLLPHSLDQLTSEIDAMKSEKTVLLPCDQLSSLSPTKFICLPCASCNAWCPLHLLSPVTALHFHAGRFTSIFSRILLTVTSRQQKYLYFISSYLFFLLNFRLIITQCILQRLLSSPFSFIPAVSLSGWLEKCRRKKL